MSNDISTETDPVLSAWVHGLRAGYAGFPETANPYTDHDVEHGRAAWWLRGREWAAMKGVQS